MSHRMAPKQPPAVPAPHPRKPNYVLWTASAVLLAGLSYLLTSSSSPSTRPGLPPVLPESYGLCSAEPGKIYTVDDAAPHVDCLAVRKDTILATGTRAEILAAWDAHQTTLVNTYYGGEAKAKKPLAIYETPPGSIVVPGLADAHAHLIPYGFKAALPLDTARSLPALLDLLEAHVRAHPDEEWVAAWGWDQTRWAGWAGGFPSAAHLEERETLKGRAIALTRVDGHAIWLSPRALELTRAAQPHGHFPASIPGGEIILDASGIPTGIFVDNAMALVPVPEWSEAQMEGYLETALRDAVAVGLTSVHDAAALPAHIALFTRFADEGRLPIRIYAMANDENATYWGDTTPRLDDRAGRLTVRSVKLFTDGALGSWGAALLEPYTDKPTTRGLMRASPESIASQIRAFWAADWGVNVHCIGDRANKVVLDAFEELLEEESRESGESVLTVAGRRRPRVEHAQILSPSDIARISRLGVIPSVQPTHATSDMWYAETRLGPERMGGAYAYASLLQGSSEGVLPLGSDFPVEGINPLLGFYAAVTRLDVTGNSPHGPDGWYPQQKLTPAQALKGATADAAYAAFAEASRGRLRSGMAADWVVFDRDWMGEPREALEARVRGTSVDGRVVYGGW